ncbi:MAG: protein phosphatase 2C domain-containing protein [Chloroflexi bacterium]|nr:protein phosphatase 2C domain-containing protein [Chloroflexota bacterium]
MASSMPIHILCPQCQHKNPEGVLICQKCGYMFKGHTTSRQKSPPELSSLSDKPGGFLDLLEAKVEAFLGLPKRPDLPPTIPSVHVSPAESSAPTVALQPAFMKMIEPFAYLPSLTPAPPVHPKGYEIGGQLQVEEVYPLKTCHYYAAADLATPNRFYLVRHSIASNSRRVVPTGHYRDLLEQNNIPNIPRALRFITFQGVRYVAYEYPSAEWQPLSAIPTPVPYLRQIIQWTLQIGHALRGLRNAEFGFFPTDLTGVEGVLIVNDNAFLMDVTLAQPGKPPVSLITGFLAHILYRLHTGKPLDEAGIASGADPVIRTIIQRGYTGQYEHIRTMLDELAQSQMQAPAPAYWRHLRQSAGTATHTGRVRGHNEDFVAKLDFSLDQSGVVSPIGLYLVADGMGGQAAGERASKESGKQSLLNFINLRILPALQARQTRGLNPQSDEEARQDLQKLVQEANRLVYEANQRSHSNQGTTMTVALVIGGKAIVANVGDSRTYLWRQGELRQITLDHSLVYGLYQAGEISREAIYSHPQRHEIYRSLGEREKIEVDSFVAELQAGDKLLLCSDGLWEMVRDPDMAQILARATSPQMACDMLIQGANQNGGKDNISVIVVHIE